MRRHIIVHSDEAPSDGPLSTTSQDAAARQASTDTQLVALWLHGRSVHTQRAYRSDVKRFQAFSGQPLRRVTLGDVQGFADSLLHLSPASQSRILSAIKSLLAFGHRIGYLAYDVGQPLRLPRQKNRLAERILSEADVHRMLALEPSRRDRVLLRLLYAGGLRVSELCALAWRDAQDRRDAGQIAVSGKGEKTRVVLLTPATWQELTGLRDGADPNAPIFRSRKGGHLDKSQVLRIVRLAGRRAGIDVAVSPHWLRHAHASHALERGCPIHLVQATLGHASVATTGRYLHARPSDSSARYLAV